MSRQSWSALGLEVNLVGHRGLFDPRYSEASVVDELCLSSLVSRKGVAMVLHDAGKRHNVHEVCAHHLQHKDIHSCQETGTCKSVLLTTDRSIFIRYWPSRPSRPHTDATTARRRRTRR